MSKVVGIDLGTTYSAIAYVNRHGKPEILANREGERITPSVVMFDGDAPMVGSIAKRAAVASPLNVVQFVKRQMGNPSWTFRTENGDSHTPEEISAIILKRLKEDAETILGEPVRDAVITVPAYFDDAQRKATQDAGRIAGLNVLRIINEPTAAALVYGVEKGEESQTILVYDLGGGTFDVTIMKVGGGEINVLATGGDKNLGGFDWDNEAMQFLNAEFSKQGGSDLFAEPALEQDLREKSEIAKKTLSSREKTTVFLSANGKTASIPFTRGQFEEITASLLKKTASIMGFVLEDSKLTWSDIDKVLLVGGSTRMKAVPALVERVTGKKPSMELHPDEVVALGAALQGMLLAVKAGTSDLVEVSSFPLVEITDVNSHSLGVIANNGDGHEYNSIILRKDTPIPATASEEYTTVVDSQREIRVRVTEGEDEDPRFVKVVVESNMPIPPYPKGAPIEVTFNYNADGMIVCKVVDLTAKRLLANIPFKRIANLTDSDVKAKQQKLSKIAVD